MRKNTPRELRTRIEDKNGGKNTPRELRKTEEKHTEGTEDKN